jgi:hypothetical protein
MKTSRPLGTTSRPLIPVKYLVEREEEAWKERERERGEAREREREEREREDTAGLRRVSWERALNIFEEEKEIGRERERKQKNCMKM